MSSHDHFVFEAIRYAPLRFLRKAYLDEETPEAIEAICRVLAERKQTITLLTEPQFSREYPLSEIAGFFTVRHDVLLLAPDGTTTAVAGRITLDQLERQLAPCGFLRPHKSWLVNYHFISRIYREKILLQNGEEIPLSRRKTTQIREQFAVLMRKEGVL